MRGVRVFILALLLCLIGMRFAVAAMDYTAFAALPVIHEGRVKPLGRAAQLILQDISGSKTPVNDVAAPWLASVLFNPETAGTVPIFVVSESGVRHALDLPPRQFYSFADLNAAFIAHADLVLSLRDLPVKDLSDDQSALLRLYARVTYFEQLKNALTQPDGTLSDTLRQQGENNIFFRVIPIAGTTSPQWQSPWQVYLASRNHDDALLGKWHDLAHAYVQDDAVQFHVAARELYDKTLARVGQTSFGARLHTELVYGAVQPHYLSLLFYLAGLALAVIAVNKPRPLWNRLTWLAVSAGLKLQIFGLVCRMFILQRPPVSNLYESILFVGTLIVAATLFMAWKSREKSFLVIAALIGSALQILGFAINDEAETLKVLQAVLDTKFWLATHVIIITSGYALCLLTSAVAHIYLYRACWSKPDGRAQKAWRQAYRLSLISLLFVGVGTLLGGVWADQSWGRFWGWDPKENGALLIAVWLIWLLHGRISHHVSDFMFGMGLAALTLVVGLSWIGVNLLGIGLHSYGFLNGSVLSLVVLFTTELGFFGLCLYRNRYASRV